MLSLSALMLVLPAYTRTGCVGKKKKVVMSLRREGKKKGQVLFLRERTPRWCITSRRTRVLQNSKR